MLSNFAFTGGVGRKLNRTSFDGVFNVCFVFLKEVPIGMEIDRVRLRLHSTIDQ